MTKRIYNTGIEDYKELIESNHFFMDKTLLIKEFIEEPAKVIMLPRPRRFGKTLNTSMLSYFFYIKEDSEHLFKDKKIWECENSKKHLNKYPVISISFKDPITTNWEDAKKGIYAKIRDLYKEHKSYLFDSLEEDEKKLYKKIVDMEVDVEIIGNSILNLSRYLEKKHNQKVIVLIDEYDNVMHKMYGKEGFDDCMELFRGIYEAGLKTNFSLHKAFMTGIMRVAREGIFSGMNNAAVYGVQDREFSENFGFLEEEIEPIIEEEGLNLKEAKEWYNGYNFGENTVYNPWSMVWYLKKRIVRPY